MLLIGMIFFGTMTTSVPYALARFEHPSHAYACNHAPIKESKINVQYAPLGTLKP